MKQISVNLQAALLFVLLGVRIKHLKDTGPRLKEGTFVQELNGRYEGVRIDLTTQAYGMFNIYYQDTDPDEAIIDIFHHTLSAPLSNGPEDYGVSYRYPDPTIGRALQNKPLSRKYKDLCAVCVQTYGLTAQAVNDFNFTHIDFKAILKDLPAALETLRERQFVTEPEYKAAAEYLAKMQKEYDKPREIPANAGDLRDVTYA